MVSDGAGEERPAQHRPAFRRRSQRSATTCRPSSPWGATWGFPYIQLNSNGVRLAADPAYAEELKRAGLFSVFLQFDGTEDRIYRAIRGRSLLDEKLQAIDHCAAAGLGVVLVPTLVPRGQHGQCRRHPEAGAGTGAGSARGPFPARQLFRPPSRASRSQRPLHPPRPDAGHRGADRRPDEDGAFLSTGMRASALLVSRQLSASAGRGTPAADQRRRRMLR